MLNHKEKSVIQLSKRGEIISRFDSISDASRLLNISGQCISGCCNGRLKSAGGYIWKFVN